MTPWTAIAIGVAGIVGSGAVNLLIIGIYFGKYRTLVDEAKETAEESRKDLVKVREDVARIKGRINGHGWRTEG